MKNINFYGYSNWIDTSDRSLVVDNYEYPIERNIGLFSTFALSKASLPQAYQSTGL